MPSTYILYSKSADSYYTGVTTESVFDRIKKHNQSDYGNHYTSKTNDWMLMLEIVSENFSTARKIELFIKRMKSRKFIEKLLNNPLEVERLKQSIV